MTPFFSIIIPVYNIDHYLHECLDSILGQSFEDWECVCVDDGSTDDSGAILDEYVEIDKRFIVLHQSNAGVSAARNAALDIARGNWIWFVDGDDAIHRHALEWAVARIHSFKDADTVCFKYVYISCEEMARRTEKKLENSMDILCQDRCSETLMAHRKGACCCLIRHKCIGLERFGSFIRGEDTLFMSHIYWETKTWLLTDAEIYFYRNRPGSAMKSIPTVVYVRDFLQTKILALQEMAKHRQQWSRQSMGSFFSSFGDYIYLNNNPLWLLSSKDRKSLLSLWLELQTLFQSLSDEKRRWQHFVFSILTVFPSACLAKFLVFFPLRMQCFYSMWRKKLCFSSN